MPNLKELCPQMEPEVPASLLKALEGQKPAPTVIVGGGSGLVLETASEAEKLGIIKPILVGGKAKIEAAAEKASIDISGWDIVTADSEVDVGAASVSLVRDGDASCAIKGDIHTDNYLRAFLSRSAGLRTDRMASHLFHMTAPVLKKPLLITDGAFNVAPTVDQRKDIASNAISVAHAIGMECPGIAVLSATESVIDSIPSSGEARQLADWINGEFAGRAAAFGPVAFDLAVSGRSAGIKRYDNPLAGDADMLLVPTIEVGNALFKMMVYFMGACSAGIVYGLKIPLVLTSRADSVAARIASIALAVKAANGVSDS